MNTTTKNTITKADVYLAMLKAAAEKPERRRTASRNFKRITPEHLEAFKAVKLRSLAEDFQDNLFLECPARATLYTVYRALKNGTDVYDAIGVGDSVLREDCFGLMADISGLDYDVFYDMWLAQ